MIIRDEPDRIYHANGAVGIHALCEFAEHGPAFFYYKYRARTFREKAGAAMQFGTLAHKMILEGEKAYEEAVAVRPTTYMAAGKKKDDPPVEKPWNGNATFCSEWAERVANAGRIVIAPEDDACLRALRRRVSENPYSSALLSRGTPELTIRNIEGGLPVQCRIDWATGDADPVYWTSINDLKTCDNLNGVKRDIYTYRYDRQAAWYQWMVQQETGIVLPFRFIFVEKAPPHRVGVWEIPENALARAHEMNMADLQSLLVYHAANEWPVGDPEGIQTAPLPDYLAKQTYNVMDAA